MKCRHCLIQFHPHWTTHTLGPDATIGHAIAFTKCAACSRFNIAHVTGPWNRSFNGMDTETGRTFLYPRHMAREPVDPSVPAEFSEDYIEACNVLEISPKASAALSRRVLQHILRERVKVKHSNLANEIQEVLDSGTVPTHIAESLDAIRNIGNFAAHPMKSTSSGEVLDVEPGEAEWNLDTVEALFDFYFVQPAKAKAKRDALNKKLADAGKPPLK